MAAAKTRRERSSLWQNRGGVLIFFPVVALFEAARDEAILPAPLFGLKEATYGGGLTLANFRVLLDFLVAFFLAAR
jgi:hypothetical protein